MDDMNYFRLCGGTFFTLIVNAALQKPTNGELYTGAENVINDENLLTSLLRIAIPSLPELSSDDALHFKQCKNKASRNLRTVKGEIGKALTDRMNSDLSTCVREMATFISKFLDTPQKKEQKLVMALLELIEQDQGISVEQLFRVCPDGNTISKRDMSEMIIVNIPSFLLGVLLYTLTEIKDNTIGQDTYNAWCPKVDVDHNRRYYQGHMGEAFNRTLIFDNSFELATDQVKESPIAEPLAGESKKQPLPKVPVPENIVETERRYVNALLDVYRERTGESDLTLDSLSSHPKLIDHLKRQRDDYYDAEMLRRGTRDIYSDDGEEYFNIFLDEVLTGVIDTYEADYSSGYARLRAVLTVAAQTTTEKCVISRETLWVGNHEKKGACHILVNRQKLSGWV